MQYQKMINFLDGATYQLVRCRTKNWLEINDKTKMEVMMLLIKSNLKLKL